MRELSIVRVRPRHQPALAQSQLYGGHVLFCPYLPSAHALSRSRAKPASQWKLPDPPRISYLSTLLGDDYAGFGNGPYRSSWRQLPRSWLARGRGQSAFGAKHDARLSQHRRTIVEPPVGGADVSGPARLLRLSAPVSKPRCGPRFVDYGCAPGGCGHATLVAAHVSWSYFSSYVHRRHGCLPAAGATQA